MNSAINLSKNAATCIKKYKTPQQIIASDSVVLKIKASTLLSEVKKTIHEIKKMAKVQKSMN